MAELADTRGVGVIGCGALHDEMPGRVVNRSLSFCSGNVICTHGNARLEAAIAEGERSKVLSESDVAQTRETIEETQIKLARWADMISVFMKSIRLREPGNHHLEFRCRIERNANAFDDPVAAEQAAIDQDVAEREATLAHLLGEDRSQWRRVHKERQVEIGQPIIDIANRLVDLGLLEFDPTPVFVDSTTLLNERLVELKLPKVSS